MSEFKAVQLKRSTTAAAVPSSSQLVEGELAINLADKKLYSKNSAGVFQLKGDIDDGSITVDKLDSDIIPDIITQALNTVYPVGSQYVNFSNATNPATLLGIGTWVAVSGRVVVGLDSADTSFDTAGETGGSKDAIAVTHTHTLVDSGHTHTTPGNVAGHFYYEGGGGASGIGVPYLAAGTTSSSVTGITIGSAGSSGTNANLQPYVVAYVWKRTA